MPTKQEALRGSLARYPSARVVLEVGCHSPWISRQLKAEGFDVIVANLDWLGSNRWVDYNAAVVDPSDPKVFWTFRELTLAEDACAINITQLLISELSTLVLLGWGIVVLAVGRRRSR